LSGLFEILIALTSLSAGLVLYLNLRDAPRLRKGSRFVVSGLLVIGLSALIDSSNGFVPYRPGQLEPAYDAIEAISYIGDAIGLFLISVGFFRWLPLLRRVDGEVRARERAETSLRQTLERSRQLNQLKRELALDHLNNGWDYDHMTRQVVERLVLALDAEEAGLWLFNADQTELRAQCGWSRTRGATRDSGRLTVENAPAAFDFVVRGAFLEAADVTECDPAAQELALAIHGAKEGAMLAAPVLKEQSISGVLSVHIADRRHVWTPEELSLIHALTNYIVVAELVLNARTLTQGARDAQNAAERASEAKTEFVANVSHELRTPLNGMLGLVRALSEAELEPAQREQVELLKGAGDQLLRVLNDLLDLSRLDAGRFQLRPETTNPARLLNEVCLLFRANAQEKGLTLDETLSGLPESVELDATRLRQCVFNLLSNAIKFTETGGVSIAAEAERLNSTACTLRITVSDSGPGMEPDQLDRLFHRYEQGGERQGQGGSGLGLVITRELARRMGGDVSVESEKGKGSRFVLTVVARLTPAQPQPAVRRDADAPSEARLADARILLVDDNAINRMVARYMLEPEGARVTEAESGAQALTLFEEQTFDLVLLDASMPVMSGEETLKRLRALNEAGASAPVIAVTAHAGAGERARFLAMGMDDYIAKPIDESDLLDTCERTLRKHQRLDASAP